MSQTLSIKRAIAPVILLSVAPGMAGAQGEAGKQPAHLTRAEMLGKVAKTTDGLATFTLPTAPYATALEVRREKSGEVEVHKAKDDLFVAHAGTATVLIGAEVEGGRETGPGEWRGGVIRNPRSFILNQGDTLWIPAGLGHQTIVAKGKSFNYLAIKFDSR